MSRHRGNSRVAKRTAYPHRDRMQPAISLIDVTKRYGDAPPALAHASVSVGKREFLAVVGGSGSGKTTLLRLINRLSEPSTGEVRVRGADVRTLDPIVVRR